MFEICWVEEMLFNVCFTVVKKYSMLTGTFNNGVVILQTEVMIGVIWYFFLNWIFLFFIITIFFFFATRFSFKEKFFR